MTRLIHHTQSRAPDYPTVLAALHRLYTAIASGHHRLAEQTLGHDEYLRAMKEARHVIQSANFGRLEHLPAVAEGEARP